MTRAARFALPLLASAGLLAIAGPAVAQRRTDFEAAVLSEAPTETDPSQCSEDDDTPPRPARPISREDRAHMIGRAIRVAAVVGDPRTRRAGLVRIATDRTDPNGQLAFRLFVVLLAGSGRTWQAIAHTEIPLQDAPFSYEDDMVRIARPEDVDDDGEEELLVVLESQTEVQCGTGYCSVRATAVLDLADPLMPLLAAVRTGLTCEAGAEPTMRGTTVFRDADGDGHRDMVVRRQECVAEYDSDTGELLPTVCTPAVTEVHRWDAATDRYLPPTVASGTE